MRTFVFLRIVFLRKTIINVELLVKIRYRNPVFHQSCMKKGRHSKGGKSKTPGATPGVKNALIATNPPSEKYNGAALRAAPFFYFGEGLFASMPVFLTPGDT